MIAARLERRADRYVAADPRFINPEGPRGTDDRDSVRWENLSQLYELKSVADGGASALVVRQILSNTDVLKVTSRPARSRG
jgi:hypothetical protein